MDDCIDFLRSASIFFTLDCNSGYWQIPVVEPDNDNTTFTKHFGKYRYTQMLFGLKNAPATCPRALEIILSEVRWHTCLIYLDDAIVFSNTVTDHIRHVDYILALLWNAKISLKLKTYFSFQPRLDYFGHIIEPRRLSVAKNTTEAFATFIFLKTLM